MLPIEIRPSIYWIGVNDRHTDLFEGLWSIRDEGVSYNSYLINDQKKVIIDLCSKMTTDELFDQIRMLMDPSELDYVVINHLEPDHTGSLLALIQIAPQVKLLGSAKMKEMLSSFYGINDNVQVVADGEEISLGSHVLKFIATPFVHWPETIMTYETTQKILFSCDGFGGYGTLNGNIFDDPLVPVEWYEKQALRYFVNIVASFSKPVKSAIAKLEGYPLDVVAPSHGLIWRNNPCRIVDLYQQWASYAGQHGDSGVTLLYASMYGNSERMMETVAQGIISEGMPLSIFNVSKASISEILASLWIKSGVMIGAPTYEGKLFPDMVTVLNMAHHKHVICKYAAGFGSCAWGGGGQRDFNSRLENLQWELLGTFEFKGMPKISELEQGRKFGAEFARSIYAK
jgi:anaerobic nitric oxide reductase flavorubredoxin